VYTLRFFSSKCSLFHNSNLFGSCIIHILYTACAKIKKNNSGSKRLKISTWRWPTYRAETCSFILTVLIGELQLCLTVRVIHKILCYWTNTTGMTDLKIQKSSFGVWSTNVTNSFVINDWPIQLQTDINKTCPHVCSVLSTESNAISSSLAISSVTVRCELSYMVGR